jgi:hypothetical protein
MCQINNVCDYDHEYKLEKLVDETKISLHQEAPGSVKLRKAHDL